MSQENEQGVKFARAASSAGTAAPTEASSNWTGRILEALEREPGDRLTCVRVFGDFYRCNWWAIGAGVAEMHLIQGLDVSTYRVRKSRLLKATVEDGRFVMEDATRATGRDPK